MNLVAGPSASLKPDSLLKMSKKQEQVGPAIGTMKKNQPDDGRLQTSSNNGEKLAGYKTKLERKSSSETARQSSFDSTNPITTQPRSRNQLLFAEERSKNSRDPRVLDEKKALERRPRDVSRERAKNSSSHGEKNMARRVSLEISSSVKVSDRIDLRERSTSIERAERRVRSSSMQTRNSTENLSGSLSESAKSKSGSKTQVKRKSSSEHLRRSDSDSTASTSTEISLTETLKRNRSKKEEKKVPAKTELKRKAGESMIDSESADYSTSEVSDNEIPQPKPIAEKKVNRALSKPKEHRSLSSQKLRESSNHSDAPKVLDAETEGGRSSTISKTTKAKITLPTSDVDEERSKHRRSKKTAESLTGSSQKVKSATSTVRASLKKNRSGELSPYLVRPRYSSKQAKLWDKKRYSFSKANDSLSMLIFNADEDQGENNSEKVTLSQAVESNHYEETARTDDDCLSDDDSFLLQGTRFSPVELDSRDVEKSVDLVMVEPEHKEKESHRRTRRHRSLNAADSSMAKSERKEKESGRRTRRHRSMDSVDLVRIEPEQKEKESNRRTARRRSANAIDMLIEPEPKEKESNRRTRRHRSMDDVSRVSVRREKEQATESVPVLKPEDLVTSNHPIFSRRDSSKSLENGLHKETFDKVETAAIDSNRSGVKMDVQKCLILNAIDKSVSFDSITVHYHTVVIGDCPRVRNGPPVALGWNRVGDPEVYHDIEKYETERGVKGAVRLLSASERCRALENAGYSRSEILRCCQQAKESKKQSPRKRKSRISLKFLKWLHCGSNRKLENFASPPLLPSNKVIKQVETSSGQKSSVSKGNTVASVKTMNVQRSMFNKGNRLSRSKRRVVI